MVTKKFINNESNEAVELNECKLTKSLNDYEARVKRIPIIDKNYVSKLNSFESDDDVLH